MIQFQFEAILFFPPKLIAFSEQVAVTKLRNFWTLTIGQQKRKQNEQATSTSIQLKNMHEAANYRITNDW